MGRRVRHLPFSLGSGTGGAALVLFAPALRGYADGVPVGTWSGVGAATISATASGSQRPTYKVAVAGGMPILRFDGSANLMVHNLNLATPNTLSVVAKTNSGGDNDYQVAFAAVAPGSPFGCNFDLKAFGSAYAGEYINGWEYSTASASAWSVLTQSQSFVSDYIYQNGVANASFSGVSRYSGDGLDRRAIGGALSENRGYASADFASIIAYALVISSALQSRIEQSSFFTFRITR